MAYASVPGMKYRHYAPRARLILVTGQPQGGGLGPVATRKFHRQGITAGYLHLNRRRNRHNANQYSEMARRLYASLRRFDELVQYILAEELNCGVLSPAVNNRLRKAATRILKVL